MNYCSMKKKLKFRCEFIQNFEAKTSEIKHYSIISAKNEINYLLKLKKLKNDDNIEFGSLLLSVSNLNQFIHSIKNIREMCFLDKNVCFYSNNYFEGLVDSFIFFENYCFQLFHIPTYKIKYDLEYFQKLLKTASTRLLIENELKNTKQDNKVKILLLSPFSVQSKINFIIELIMKKAGIRILKSEFVSKIDDLPFIFDGFHKNDVLFRLISSFYEKRESYMIIYESDFANNHFQDSFVQNLFNFDKNVTFQGINKLLKMNVFEYEQFSNQKSQKNAKIQEKYQKIAKKSSFSIFDFSEYFKNIFSFQNNDNNISITFEKYKKYQYQIFLAKYFGLFYINKELPPAKFDLFQKTRPVAFFIRPNFVCFKEAIWFFLQKLG